MNHIKTQTIAAAVLASLVLSGVASFALAVVTPSLLLTWNASNVQITVTADPNASVQLYYINSYNYQNNSQYNYNYGGQGYFVGNIGTTSYSGYLTTMVNYGQYTIPANSYVYVMVNGAQSAPVLWLGQGNYNNNNNYSNNNNNYGQQISFSQNSITLAAGQTTTVTIYGSYTNNYYLSSNNYSSVATATVNGSTITLYGSNTGTANFTVCSYANNSCANLQVTVYGNNTYPQNPYYPTPPPPQYQAPISLSQNNVYLNVGQQMSVSIYGGNYYYMSDIVPPNVVSAMVSGNTINLIGYRPGSTNVTVCQSVNSCATVYITVGGGYYPYSY